VLYGEESKRKNKTKLTPTTVDKNQILLEVPSVGLGQVSFAIEAMALLW
jgi:hypothetical protein